MCAADNCPHVDLTMRPHHLMCLFCLRGGGDPPDREAADLDAKLEAIQKDRNLLIRLKTAFDCIGGPTTFPEQYDPATRRKDLQVLRALNLVPDSIRNARELLMRWLPKDVPHLEGICRLERQSGPAWQECPVARSDAYQKGLEEGIIVLREAEEKARAKEESCAEIASTGRLQVRPHHLLCILCAYGGGMREPLVEDNLWEVLVRSRENPDVEIELIEGACMVCPPCTGYDPERGICDAGCGLRDRLKDLNTFYMLGLQHGDVLPARQLWALLFDKIESLADICDNPDGVVPEWATCGGTHSGKYERLRAEGVDKLLNPDE
jgi:hypothetical protein